MPKKKKKGGEALDFCGAPGPASPAAFLGTMVAFRGKKEDMWGYGLEGSAGSGTAAHPQGSEGGRAVEWDKCPCYAAGARKAPGHPQRTGKPGCITGHPGKPGEHRCSWIKSKTPGS